MRKTTLRFFNFMLHHMKLDSNGFAEYMYCICEGVFVCMSMHLHTAAGPWK